MLVRRISVLLFLSVPACWAARGTTGISNASAIVNVSNAPLSNSAGPFTLAFWFRLGNVNTGQSYIAEGYQGGHQWAVSYGYTGHQIEFYVSSNAVRANSGITINDTSWHHIAYRKSASGASSWDKFLDGVKTNINPSIAFSLPPVNSLYVFNEHNFQAPCLCSLGDLVFYSVDLSDSEIQSLAQGHRPPSLAKQSALYWPLEGTSSPEPDGSGNNHLGTILGSVVQMPDPPYSSGNQASPSNTGPVAPGAVLGTIGAMPSPPSSASASRVTAPNAPSDSVIENLSFGPLSSSNGPFTIAFWFQTENVNPGQSYIMEGFGNGQQWAVIYGYTPEEIEFYTGDAVVGQNTGIAISDMRWHHVAYRKNASGSSEWDKFLDGVKTEINSSLNFSLPPVSSFYALNAVNGQALCKCGLADLALYNSALADSQIQQLAAGGRPSSLPEPPVLYWPMTGAVPEPDASGNNHPGTIVGSLSTQASPPYEGTVVVTPSTATLEPLGSQQFQASVAGGISPVTSPVTWLLNPNFGTISPGGIYQAPSVVPVPTTVIITAISNAVPTQYKTAFVTVNPSPSPITVNLSPPPITVNPSVPPVTANPSAPPVTVNPSAPPATSGAILTAQYDLSRTSSNTNENILTNSNINVNTFGKLFSMAVQGYVYAQPLYVPSSLIPALGQNTVFVATMHDMLYAFNADTGAELWSLSLGAPQSVAYDFLGPETGVLSTPVIDPVRQILYVVGRNDDGWRIHSINLITHAERIGSPVLIQGSVSGPNGYDSVKGTVTFNANQELQRAALLEANNTIYVGFAAIGDINPWHGWMFGYNADTLAPSIACITPNGGQGGIWMSGGGPAADAAGNVYFITGNGSWDGQTDFGSSFIKMSPNLAVLDWFTPSDWLTLNSDDADLGASRAVLLPATSLVTGGGKDGSLWLLNQATGQMGHAQGGSGNPAIVQTFQATTDLVTTGNPTNGLFDGLAYWSSAPGGGLLFVHGSNDYLKSFRLTNGTFNTTPVATTSVSRPYPGGVLAVSSNGSSGGILWATTPDSATDSGTSTGELRAFDALTLTELWNSNQNSARDALGTYAKFSTPTVVNGKVYVSTFSNQVVAYGLLP